MVINSTDPKIGHMRSEVHYMIQIDISCNTVPMLVV